MAAVDSEASAGGRDLVGPRPIVSIGMPVFNGQRCVSSAIESMLAQDIGDVEPVISDNGSTDSDDTEHDERSIRRLKNPWTRNVWFDHPDGSASAPAWRLARGYANNIRRAEIGLDDRTVGVHDARRMGRSELSAACQASRPMGLDAMASFATTGAHRAECKQHEDEAYGYTS